MLIAVTLIIVIAAAGIMYWNVSANATKPGDFSFAWLPAANDDAPGASFDRHFAPKSRRGATQEKDTLGSIRKSGGISGIRQKKPDQ
jgi:hypothetical protein